MAIASMQINSINRRFGLLGEVLPFVSVALPVFNAGMYLSEAIDSILNQTFSDFELIIINDGSTDDSLSLLREYEGRDSRIVLISRENRGLVSTLNEAVDLARGTWLARMDQDDIALPHRFERQLAWLEESDADICGSWAKLFGTKDSRILKHAQTDEAIKLEMLFGTTFAHPSVMMKTEYLKQLRYDKAWEKCEDYDLWERAARAGWKMGNVPEVLLLYRQHADQISSKLFVSQQKLTQKIRRRYWLHRFSPNVLSESCIEEVLKIREPIVGAVDINAVENAFVYLLQRAKGESRAVVFEHFARLYYRIAGFSPRVAYSWLRINRVYGCGSGVLVAFKFFVLSVLRVNSDSWLFKLLKKCYFFTGRSS
jgi:glycosyltransferase involved in cell wall biosynthesis